MSLETFNGELTRIVLTAKKVTIVFAIDDSAIVPRENEAQRAYKYQGAQVKLTTGDGRESWLQADGKRVENVSSDKTTWTFSGVAISADYALLLFDQLGHQFDVELRHGTKEMWPTE